MISKFEFVFVVIRCHLVNNFILSKIFLMRFYWLEFQAKYFASIRFNNQNTTAITWEEAQCKYPHSNNVMKGTENFLK